MRDAISGAALVDETKLQTALGPLFDVLRQTLWTVTQPKTALKGPLAIFRNQTDAVPLLRAVMQEHYGLTADPVIAQKAAATMAGEQYPEANKPSSAIRLG